MLKINYNGCIVNVKFNYKIEDNFMNEERRCTWVQVIFPDDNTEFHGKAICHPCDNFNKSTGRKIALANAMVDHNIFDRNLRKAIWAEYHKCCK